MIDLTGITPFTMIEIKEIFNPNHWLPGTVQHIDAKKIKVELLNSEYLPAGVNFPIQYDMDGKVRSRHLATEETIIKWRKMIPKTRETIREISNYLYEIKNPPPEWEPCNHKMTIYLKETTYRNLVACARKYRNKPAAKARHIIENILDD